MSDDRERASEVLLAFHAADMGRGDDDLVARLASHFREVREIGRLEAQTAITAWLKSIPEEWIDDWGLNATAEITDHIEGGTWKLGDMQEPSGPK